MRKTLLVRFALFIALTMVGACTVHQTEVPSPTGPSEFGTSITVTAIPDSISRDGASQSSVVVTARGPDGQAVSGIPIRLDMTVAGAIQDFGTLSARTLVTGSDGRASAIYTAPPAPPAGTAVPVSILTIQASPISYNAQTLEPRTADIRLVPVGVILPTGGGPTPKFTFSPVTPAAGSAVAFDASSSCAGPLDSAALCSASSGAIVSYQWDFGDGSFATGKVASHLFTTQQTYAVTLTVTNDHGASASSTQGVPVGAGILPTGDFTVSPTPVNVNDTVFFNADGIKPGPGRTIVVFNWNFGDNGTASGGQVSHVFTAAGTYSVVLSVADDVGQKQTFTKTVTVGSGNPSAVLALIKTGGNSIQGDGSASTAVGSASITNYNFAWGDVSPNTSGSAAVAPHTYGVAGTYTVRLTVTDSLGRTGTTTQVVTVP